MNMHHRFETARASTGRESTVRKMLSDLVLACQQIEADIATEDRSPRMGLAAGGGARGAGGLGCDDNG